MVFIATVVLAAIQFVTTPIRAQDGGYDDENAEVLTRGPVHEAFATVVDYNPGRGLVTRVRPPDPIEELPPEERPVGDNVAWIPGYWAWDDEKSDYIWVSGTWRVPPPGREWVPGYWADSQGEFIWIAGYWAEVDGRETTYLPPPPESLERGPNTDRPSIDHGWTPGCWIWQRGDYVWRPGYWARGRGDWIWVPAYYVWTQHGYIFIDGYWDYEVARRGVIYAPVRFRSRVYSRRGYHYSPRIVFNIGLFSDHLFLRPRWCHYYFGDYYAPRYADAGFFFTFSYHYGWRGYDPFYSYWCWENRRERDWESRYQASYRYRREHELARPPSTWAAQVAVYSSTTATTASRAIVAGTTTQLASTGEFSPRFRRVSEEERRTWTDRSRQVRTSREERRTLEVQAAGGSARSAGAVTEPARVERSRSPIASKPTRELKREFAPPIVPKAPKPDPKVRSGGAVRPGRPDDPPRRGVAQPEADRPTRPTVRSEESARGRSPSIQREAKERPRETRAAAGRRDQDRPAEGEGRERNETRARERSAAQERERSDAQARERSENARNAREQRESAERERAGKARVAEEKRQREAEVRRSRELLVAERRANENEARAKREAQLQEQRTAEQRTKVDRASAKAEEAQQRAKEASAKKAIGSQEKKRGNSAEEDDAEMKKGNGRP